MKQLQKLNLSTKQRNMSGTTLPDSIGKLTQLQVLEVSGKNLKSLPDSIGELPTCGTST